jgi:hypothetical protein
MKYTGEYDMRFVGIWRKEYGESAAIFEEELQ